MPLVIIALVVFGIGTGALINWMLKKPSPIRVSAAILFVVVYISAIIWALKEF